MRAARHSLRRASAWVPALTCLLLAGAMVISSSSASAQAAPTPQPGTSSEPNPTLVLLFEPERPDSSRLVRAIASHLVGLPVRVVLEPLARDEILTWLESGHTRARARAALGLVAIDTGRQNSWRLFFLDVDGAPTLIWRLRPSPEHAPLDEAGVAVRLLVDALLDAEPPSRAAGGLPGESSSTNASPPERGTAHQPGGSKAREPPRKPPHRTRPATTPQASPGTTRGETPQRRQRDIAVFLGPSTTTWVANQGFQFGATGGLELQLARAWSLALAYTWYPTFEYRLADTDLTLSRRPVMSYIAHAPASGFSPRFWLGMWADPVLRDTPITAGTYRAKEARTTWSWGPLAGVGLISPSLFSVRARLDLGVEVDARRVEYVADGQTRELLAATRQVRPFLSFGLSLPL